MSIRARLILAFAGLLGLLFAVAAVSLQRLEGLTVTTQEIVDYQVRRVFLAQRANQHAQGAALRLLTLLQTPGREQRIPLYAAMDAELAASDRAISDLGKTMITADVQADVARVLTLRKRYGEAFQETVELIEIEGLTAARAQFANQTQTALDALLRETLALATRQQQVMQVEVAQLRHAAANARLLVFILAGAALLAGTLLAWIIARSIALPLKESVVVAETIAGGDYGMAIPVGKGDEIGALLRALTIMRDSIASREERISRLAYIDPLTGLSNRNRFLETLGGIAGTTAGALLILNIERFAAINNALGYAVGDRLLIEISERLTRSLPAGTLVARLGGDEFALLLERADQAAAISHARTVLSALREPMRVDGQQLDIDAHMGIASYPQDGIHVTVLLRRADRALKLAKRRHEGFALGKEIADEPHHEQLSLIGEMRTALEREEFVVYYQPKLDLARQQITGAEALLRWRHPVKGIIPPGNFIPFAEQTGFIREITPWLLQRVIADAVSWKACGVSVKVSANLSTLDLTNHAMVTGVFALLERAGLSASLLCLEITESALMDDPELALKHMVELSANGLMLSIDDYGTGQASLAYVSTLPVNELKIDRAFVTHVDSSPRNAAIVRSTILLCRELGLTVVAEGAETPAEIEWLTNNGCDMIQGYGIARPMPLDAFIPWVKEFNGRNSVEESQNASARS